MLVRAPRDTLNPRESITSERLNGMTKTQGVPKLTAWALRLGSLCLLSRG